MKNADLNKILLGQMAGKIPPDTYESNGCTMAPDEILGVDLRTACHCHDWQYGLGATERDRLNADRRFYYNLRKCGVSGLIAGMYYRRVRLWGWRFFPYALGEEPSRFDVLKIFFLRYFGF